MRTFVVVHFKFNTTLPVPFDSRVLVCLAFTVSLMAIVTVLLNPARNTNLNLRVCGYLAGSNLPVYPE